jgi:hypothetical protein
MEGRFSDCRYYCTNNETGSISVIPASVCDTIRILNYHDQINDKTSLGLYFLLYTHFSISNSVG